MSAELAAKQAAKQRLEGDIAGARAACDAILADNPDMAEALGLRAVCKAEMGEGESAAEDIARAIELNAADPILRMHHSVVAESNGRLDEALAAARLACDLGRDRFEVWGRCGDLAGRMGHYAEAEKALSRALELHPGHAALALRLAGARMELGDHAGMAEILERLPAELADHPETLRLRMVAHRHRGEWADMARIAERLISLSPGEEEAVGGLAFALSQQGYYNKASRVYAPLVERAPHDPERWSALGRFRLGARQLDEARRCFETALQLDPDCAEATFGMSRLLTFLGDLDGAEAMCRRTLAIDPENAEAYGQLCEVSGGKVSDEELERLDTLVYDGDLPHDRLAIALFALGDIHHARKDADSAFDAWRKANDSKLALTSPGRPAYSRTGQERTRRSLETLFAEAVAQRAPADEPTPIFIVGMPRSGTTLLETVVSAHSKVASGGELPLMPFLLEECLAWAKASGWRGGALPDDKRLEWRQRYLAQRAAFGVADKPYFTDKQPSNAFSVGLIRQLFPQAPVLHIRRNPVECGFSIYRRNFSGHWPFASRLEDIAHYYGEYARVMEHWERVFPGHCGFIQYEKLVDDFEGGVRAALDHVGLPFEQACAEYWKQDRTVMTFSATQVRKPPTPGHKSSTERYRDHLEPLGHSLKEAGLDIETGALAGSAPPSGTAKRGLLGRLFS